MSSEYWLAVSQLIRLWSTSTAGAQGFTAGARALSGLAPPWRRHCDVNRVYVYPESDIDYESDSD